MNSTNKSIVRTIILILTYGLIGTLFLWLAGLSLQASFSLGILFGYMMDILVSIYGVLCDIKKGDISTKEDTSTKKILKG